MSFIGDFFGFGGADSTEDAARIQARAATEAAQIGAQGSQAGIDELMRQFNLTRESFAPFVGVGERAIGRVEDASTIGGFNRRIGRIQDTDIFGSLVDERQRALQSQLAAGGLTRSGTALNQIADIPDRTALAIENLLAGRSQNLLGGGQGAAAGLGGFGAQASGGIANLLGQQFGAQALGVQQAGQATSGGILAGQRVNQQATQNVLNTAASIGQIFFSDPALKENVEQIGEIGDLRLYQWDWIPEVKGTIIEKCMTIGFMADEVFKKYPQHIEEFGGFMTIKLRDLLDELKAANDVHLGNLRMVA